VIPGARLMVTVAQNGVNSLGNQPGAGGSGDGSGGGGGGANLYEAEDGGGGGGASAVYVGTNALVVAGGGGGGGGLHGADGGAAGKAARFESICNGGGGAGSQTRGGAGGVCHNPVLPGGPGGSGSGHDGGAGGQAGNPVNGREVGGGGGGGGLFGGGGGQADGGGGGSSYPAADATGFDFSERPSVTISTLDFYIATGGLPPATPGTAYGPVALQVANEGTSTSPYTTTLKWKKVTLPKGLKLSTAGMLSGTPKASLAAPTSVTVQVTETVTTLNGKSKPVKTKTMVQATIPFV
jgi:hypothetical protein